MLFALGFFIGQYILINWYKSEGKSEKDVERITLYVVMATIIGARLGHCLFYEPGYYLSNPIEILKVWKGGLASHGAAAGILFGIYLYARKTSDQSFLYVLDRLVILVAIGGGFIRLGNLMNSEIIGKPADLPWSMVYTYSSSDRLMNYYPDAIKDIELMKSENADQKAEGRVPMDLKIEFYEPVDSLSAALFIEDQVKSTIDADSELSKFLQINPEGKLTVANTGVNLEVLAIPRHPTQLYESISYFLIAFVLYYFIYRREKGFAEGKIFSWFLVLLFGGRFFHEFFKENQVGFEDGISFNMGQLLSIPLILAGVLIYVLKVIPAEKQKAK